MAVNKINYGSETLIDLTEDTATTDTVAAGRTFHLANGTRTTGAATYAGSSVANGPATSTCAILHGYVDDSSSSSTAFVAEVDGIDDLYNGVCAIIENGSIDSNEAGFTLEVNDLEAYNVVNNMNLTTNNVSFKSGDKALFIFLEDPGVWIMHQGQVNSVNGYTHDVQLTAEDVGASPQMVILAYGKSKWNDFITAYNHKNIVYCRASSGSNPASGSQTRMAFLAYVNNETSPTEVEFQYYRSVSSHSANQQGDQVYVYKLNSSNAWSVTVRESYSKIITGSGLTSTYASSAITLKHSNSVTGGTVGTSTATSGSTLDVPYVTYDNEGHITAAGTHTHTVSLPVASTSSIGGVMVDGTTITINNGVISLNLNNANTTSY